METVEVVIRMPKQDFDFIKDEFADGDMPDEKDLKETIYYAIANGTVLPKRHGDLKDVDEIERIWKKGNYVRSALLFAPTVIEADKEVDDGRENG